MWLWGVKAVKQFLLFFDCLGRSLDAKKDIYSFSFGVPLTRPSMAYFTDEPSPIQQAEAGYEIKEAKN